jgi:hypothetical protein
VKKRLQLPETSGNLTKIEKLFSRLTTAHPWRCFDILAKNLDEEDEIITTLY